MHTIEPWSKKSGAGLGGFARQSGALSVPSCERNVPSLVYVHVCFGSLVHGRSCTAEPDPPSQPATAPPRSHTSTHLPFCEVARHRRFRQLLTLHCVAAAKGEGRWCCELASHKADTPAYCVERPSPQNNSTPRSEPALGSCQIVAPSHRCSARGRRAYRRYLRRSFPSCLRNLDE